MEKKLTALQKLINKWESEKGSYIPNSPIYQCFINEAKEMLELEKEQIIDAVNKTSQHDCAIANSVLRRLKKPEIFQFDEKGGEQYYNETYGNKESN